MTATFSCPSRPRVLVAGLLIFLATACLNFNLRPPLEKAEWGLRKRLVVQGFRSMRLGQQALAGRAFQLAMTPGALVEPPRQSGDSSELYWVYKLKAVEGLCHSLEYSQDYKGEARLLSRLNKIYRIANIDYSRAQVTYWQYHCEELRGHTCRAALFRQTAKEQCRSLLTKQRGDSIGASILLSNIYLKEGRLQEAEAVLADQLAQSLSSKSRNRNFDIYDATSILVDRLRTQGAEYTSKRIFALLEARGKTPDFSTKFMLLRQMQNTYVMRENNEAAEDTALIIAREIEAHRVSGK
ncbi:MAG: hypothetical protein SFV17_01300 [Candidatus Obscuribacter sp.]|nr:hypothetical protein [Candidatus Obscuribacter sp.]